jgi:hypothetical protein
MNTSMSLHPHATAQFTIEVAHTTTPVPHVAGATSSIQAAIGLFWQQLRQNYLWKMVHSLLKDGVTMSIQHIWAPNECSPPHTHEQTMSTDTRPQVFTIPAKRMIAGSMQATNSVPHAGPKRRPQGRFMGTAV